jgi:ABC-2 type transport system permease protein
VASVLPVWLRARLFAMLDPARGGVFGHDGLLWLPVRAAAGEPRDLVLWCLVSVAVFAAAIALLGPPFVAFAAQAAGAAADRPREARRAKPMAFGAGEGRALRSKEWRLLRRDPWLLSQIFLQVIYTLPIGVLIWHSTSLHGSIALSAGPTIVVVACQVSASFAWLVISSEEAPDLLQASPVSRRAVEIRKLQAIAPPLAVLLGPPLLILAWFEPASAALTLAFGICAATSSALLNFWHPMPGRRAEVLRRHAQSKLVGLMEHLLSLTWAIAIVLALLGSALALAPIAFAGILLYVNRPARSRRRATEAARV